jgi:membrane protease YdiL (CAAX protease family)
MSTPSAPSDPAGPQPGASTWRGYAWPIASGLGILVVSVGPWTLLADLNARVRPDLPWAALTTVAYVAALLAWLGGVGGRERTATERRKRLRLWPPSAREEDADGVPTVALVALFALLYGAWIAIGRLSPVPDLTAYPTTTYRWSMFLMGGLMSGVVEEAAYRGYMQTGLERHDPRNAILITSVVFVVSHLTQGIEAVLLLGPGLFVASLLYGTLAQRTGTILPGIVIHVLGDLAYVYFGVLRGQADLLFAS